MKTCAVGAERKMKMKRTSRRSRRPVKAYSNYIYRIMKESPAVKDSVALPGRLWAELSSQVGEEAARLAKLNQRSTITQREVCSAVRAVRKNMKRNEEPGA